MKRGSANMWWIIIGAVIALVVMIILMVMFTGKTSKLEGGLLECEGKGGKCLSEPDCNLGDGTTSKAFDCSKSSTNSAGVCCFGYSETEKTKAQSK